jgi:hypothetical protein
MNPEMVANGASGSTASPLKRAGDKLVNCSPATLTAFS